MRLFRLGGIKRLFLSLAISFFLVLILTSISWYSKPTYGTVDYAALLDRIEKESAIPLDRVDAAIEAITPPPAPSKPYESAETYDFESDDIAAKQKSYSDFAIEDHLKNKKNLKPDYFSYLWDDIFDGAGAAFISIAAGLFLVLSTINQYFNEVSIGWKRLSIVSSFLITLLIGSYSYLSQALRGDDMFLSLLAMPISMALLLYSKVIYAWIKDGFKADKI